jgi:aspartyl-tRNA(Asn)/glutamyl-tRNA(Gln) amidotransferase subunit A
MARTAHDCAQILEAIVGYDPADLSAIDRPLLPMAETSASELENYRIGILVEFLSAPQLDLEVRAAVESAVKRLAAAGADVVEESAPFLEEAYAAWWATTFAEGYAYHENTLRSDYELYGQATRQSLLTGVLLSAADYVQAQRMRTLVSQECSRIFENVDVLVVPCTAETAPQSEDWDSFETLSFTTLWSLVGYPALSLCCGFSSSGMPIGMQIVGRPFHDLQVLGIGHHYQQLTNWHQKLPQAHMTGGKEA